MLNAATPLNFAKFHGCGNDFLIFDNRELNFPHTHSAYIRSLCDRHRGVGSDGILLLENSLSADYKMRIFNADGFEAGMCGNGLRCLMGYIRQFIHPRKMCSIESKYFCHHLSWENNIVSASMQDPIQITWNLQVADFKGHFLNTGVPHFVYFVDDLESFDVIKHGKFLRQHPHFSSEGTNVNFVKLLNDNNLSVRTFERGVEGETFACGTGAIAAAIAASYEYKLLNPLEVHVRSGDTLTIHFSFLKGIPSNVKMSGPCTFLFTGSLSSQ